MRKTLYRISALILFIFGLSFTLIFQRDLTGAVIGISVYPGVSSFIGLILVLLGLALLTTSNRGGLEKRIKKIKSQIQEDIKSGRIGDYNELRSYAKKLGYEVVAGSKHWKVLKEGYKITEIPMHTRGIATGTYRSILKALDKYS